MSKVNRNLSYYDILKAKESFTCQDCMQTILAKQFFFRVYDAAINFKYLCVDCAQLWFKKEIEKLQQKILDLKNIEGKACILSDEYKRKKGENDGKETLNSN